MFGSDPLPFWIQKEREIVWDTVCFGYLYSADRGGISFILEKRFLVSPPTL